MRDWCLARVIWVADRGFTSAENRRYLRKGGGHYIIGEKLRSGSAEAAAALSRQGRYKDVAGNLQGQGSPDRRGRAVRHLLQPRGRRTRRRRPRPHDQPSSKGLIRDTDKLSRDKRAELRGVISTKPGLNRYLRVTPGGLLRIDAAQGEGRGEPRRQVPAAHLRPEDDRRGHRPRIQAAPGSRARLAGHEAGHRPAPRLPPQGRAHPRPRHPVLARPAPGPRSPRTPAAAPGRNCAASSTASTSAPSPAPPAPSGSAPRSPKPSATSSTP